jgi:Fe-S cluster assembly protein SufB
MNHESNAEILEQLGRRYDAGFVTDIESDALPPGLSEDTIRFLSAKKDEPEWMLQWRLSAYRHWLTMPMPNWAKLDIAPIDFQAISYYSAPKAKYASLDEVPQELLDTYEKLGVPLHERAKLAGVAVDAVFDSVSVGTTFRKELAEKGIVFCSMSEAIREHPELVQQYLGSVVPTGDNYFAALNSAVFSDGSFVFIPKGVRCPMELSTYFRINAVNTGQFERTLIIAEDKSYVSYLEGCTAPMRDENQLHAAVVELVALEDAEIKYSTVQNWYPGDEEGRGGIYNFVTKRAECRGARSKVSWTQVETGSAITWKYPSCVLLGDDSVGEFHSVALTHHRQQADTGTKMIHVGKRTKSKIVSKGISAGRGQNAYRGLVKVERSAQGRAQPHAVRLAADRQEVRRAHLSVHRSEAPHRDRRARSDDLEDQRRPAVLLPQPRHFRRRRRSMIVDGFCKSVFRELPMEFAVEAKKLLEVSLEGAVG